MREREITTPTGEQLDVAVDWLPRQRRWAQRFRAWQKRRSFNTDSLDASAFDFADDLAGLVIGIVALIAFVIAVLLLWWLVLPALLLLLDLLLIALLVVIGVATRILLRRPWTVSVRRGEEVVAQNSVIGWRRAHRTRDAIADALASGRVTPELAHTVSVD